jgi:type II secretory pathway pseudopilin PulG
VKKNGKSLNRNEGYTLAEVLVAVIISMLIIIPTLSSFLMGRIETDIAKHRTQAMNLIRARIEYLNSQGYYYLNTIPNGTATESLYLDSNEKGNSIPCTRTTVITDADGDDLLETEVIVSWKERRLGATSTVRESVMTLFSPTRVFE